MRKRKHKAKFSNLQTAVALGHSGFGGDYGGAQGGCVGLGMGFEEEHEVAALG